MPLQEKSGNLFYDTGISAHIKKSGNLINGPRFNKCPYKKKSGNLFNDPRINKRAHTKNWKIE